MKIISTFLLATLLCSFSAIAQDAPVYETVIEDVVFNSSSRTIIDEETIKNSRSPDLTTLISAAANIAVTSTAFQPNSIFVRGGDASHVLIVLDGVPFYDASTSQRTLNLNTIDIRSVRKIEIIKGSQTVLYGGQALTAVIKIDTIPKDFVSQTGVQAVVGGFDYRDLSFVQLTPTSEDRGLVFRGRGTWKEKPSPIITSDQTYSSQGISGDVSYLQKGSTEFVLKAQFLQDLAESSGTSPTTAATIDADQFEVFSRQYAGSGIFRFKEIAWSPRVAFGVQNSVRQFDWPKNASNPNPTLTQEDYGANLRTVRLEANPIVTDDYNLLVGSSYTFEEFVFRDKGEEQFNRYNEQRGIFAKLDYNFSEDFDVNFGLRAEQWSSKVPVGSYQLGFRYYKTKLEISTGYKIPSSFQLYSSYGNPDLDAETAEQVSLTQDLQVADNLTVSATLFGVNYKDLILATGSFPNLEYNNVDRSQVRGIELVTTYRPFTSSLVQLALGYQEPTNPDTGQRLIRRPLTNGSLRWTENFEQSSLFAEIIASGDRWDYSNRFRTTQKNLEAYQIVNAAYTYRWSDQLNIFARANNLFNNRYEETYTYYVEGVSYQAGLEAWF